MGSRTYLAVLQAHDLLDVGDLCVVGDLRGAGVTHVEQLSPAGPQHRTFNLYREENAQYLPPNFLAQDTSVHEGINHCPEGGDCTCEDGCTLQGKLPIEGAAERDEGIGSTPQGEDAVAVAPDH